jgi:hypothetical protein
MSFGGSSKPKTPKTVTTSSTYTPAGQPLIDPVVSAAEKFLMNPPTMPGYSTVAGFTPNQTMAHDLLLGTIPGQQNFMANATNANRFLLGDVLDPNSNRFLRDTIEASVRPIREDFLESILPGIRGEAITAGQFGGSRQGIAEGIAARGAQTAASEAAARIGSEGYSRGLDAMTRALSMVPQTMGAMTLPGLLAAGVGEQQQGLNQAMLDEQFQRDMFAQLSPWLAAKEVAGVGGALPGGTSTATTPNPVYMQQQQAAAQQPSTLQQLLGLGAMGLSFLPVPGAKPLSMAAQSASMWPALA